MKVVIVSGGIGSGKSTVCRMLEDRYGWPVYEADSRVKHLYMTHPSLLSDIEKALEASFRDGNGEFRPSALASRIFSDRAALEAVESLVFPVLTEDFVSWKRSHSDKEFVVLESATILEKPQLFSLGDFVAVVDAPLQSRVARAAVRDSVSEEKIMERAANQKLMNAISSGDVPSYVSWVIRNDGSQDDLSAEVAEFVGNLSDNKNVKKINDNVK